MGIHFSQNQKESSNAKPVVQGEKGGRHGINTLWVSERIFLAQDVLNWFDSACIFLKSIQGENKSVLLLKSSCIGIFQRLK